MAISLVGSLYSTYGSATTLSVSPTATGDVLVFFAQNVSDVSTASAVNGGGVTNWNKAAYSNASGAGDAEIWWGVITATGSSTITVTFPGGSNHNLGALQFTAGAGYYWYQDGPGGGTTGTAKATSGNYPSLTPSGSGELYVGTALLAGGGPGGATSGYTYTDPLSFGYGQIVYDPNCSSSAQSPAWTQGNGYYSAVGVLLLADTTPYPTAGAGLLPLLETF